MDNLLAIVEKNNNLPNVTLNFDALREEGTAYIAQLGHRLWTDFNVHDPGITILEVLCYAINDLAYRTSFPIEDILTGSNPLEDKKQFFTAAEILTCCPVTPLDFRKVIIDVEDVKNAWLFKAGIGDQNYCREYFSLKNNQELKTIAETIKKIKEYFDNDQNPSFPTTYSQEEFFRLLKERIPSLSINPCDYCLLFDFLVNKTEVFCTRKDINQLSLVLEIVSFINLTEDELVNKIETALITRGLTPGDFEEQIDFITNLIINRSITNENKGKFFDLSRLITQEIYHRKLTNDTLDNCIRLIFTDTEYHNSAKELIRSYSYRNELVQLAFILNIVNTLNLNEIRDQGDDAGNNLASAIKNKLPNGANNNLFDSQIDKLKTLFTTQNGNYLLNENNKSKYLELVNKLLNEVIPEDYCYPISTKDLNNVLSLDDFNFNEGEILTGRNLLIDTKLTNQSFLIRRNIQAIKDFINKIKTIEFIAQDSLEVIKQKINADFEGQNGPAPKEIIDLFLSAFHIDCGNAIIKLKEKTDNFTDIIGIQNSTDKVGFIGKVLAFKQEGYEDIALTKDEIIEIFDEFPNLKDNYANEVAALIAYPTLPFYDIKSQADLQKVIDFFIAISGLNIEPAYNKDAFLQQFSNIFGANPELADLFKRHFVCWRIIYCNPADIPVGQSPEPYALNGLYSICIELEDYINPDDTMTVNEIKERVLKRLCNYRNLCEDFLSIDVIGAKPICIDATITVEDNADENAVNAEVFYRIQQFFSPSLNFYSLEEMMAKGKKCDEIFQGTILEHGFLDDDEVEDARLRRVIYKSDLYQVIMDVPGVKAIKCLNIHLCDEDDRACAYDNEWCLDICQKEQAEADAQTETKEKYSASIFCKHKPLLNIASSRIIIQKGRLTIPTDAQDVAEKLNSITRLNQKLPVNGIRDISIPQGVYRDIDQYFSIQEDFPLVYRVGKNQIPRKFPADRRAFVKQLKGYLTFFDQILANYLAQLGQVKNLLSVSQEPEDRTLFFKSLRGLDPGIDLLFFDAYQITHQVLEDLEGKLDASKIEKLAALKTIPPLHAETFVSTVLNTLQVQQLDQDVWDVIFEGSFIQDYYEQQLDSIMENQLERFNRHNKTLDHLIARFGEVFTDYAISLYQTCPDDPCKAGKIRVKDNLLKCKTSFLKSIPIIGSHRGKGLNYKAEDCIRKELFWNADNVTGVKKRVSKLLCLPHSTRVQLACQPKAEVVKKIDEERRCFSFVVVEKGQDPEAPETQIYLHGLKEYGLREKGKRELDKIRSALLKANENARDGKPQLWVEQEDAVLDLWVLHLRDEKGEVVAKSILFATEEAAKTLRDKLIRLIFPDDCITEGFHVVEHILMRPISEDVAALNPFRLGSDCNCKVNDPYSFWISVVALDKWKRFSPQNGARNFFEQTVRRETPAHIGINFLWLTGEQMYRFEYAYKNWLYDLARQGSDDCQIEESLTNFVHIMNELLSSQCQEISVKEEIC